MSEVKLSATLYERFLTCPKSAAFSIDKNFNNLAMPSLRSALGNVSHRLIEKSVRIPQGWSEAQISEWFEVNWESCVEEQFSNLIAKWHPNTVLKPQSWPGYFATRSSAKSLVIKNSGLLPPKTINGETKNYISYFSNDLILPLIERYLISEDLGIAGKPDLVFIENKKATIYDYKFGNNQMDLEKHKIQMYFYKLLVESVLKIEVGKLWIVASANKKWEIPLNQKELDDLAADVPRVLNALKTNKVAAVPSLINCRFCSFKSICDQFKDANFEVYPGRPMAIFGEVLQVRSIDEDFQELRIISKTKNESVERTVFGVPKGHTVKSGDMIFLSDNLDFKDAKIIGFSWNSRIFISG